MQHGILPTGTEGKVSLTSRLWRTAVDNLARPPCFSPSLPIIHCLSSGVEASLAAASSGDRGALWWGPKSAGFYLGGKKGTLWRGSAFCASACRIDVLRRLLRGNLRHTAKAGSSTHSFCARALRGRGLGGIRGDFRQCMDNSGARPSHCTCGRPRCVRIPLLFREFARTVERHKAERR